MPSAQLVLGSPPKSSEHDNQILPPLIRTPSGVVLIDIQGVINVGESPLIPTELDLGTDPLGNRRSEPVSIGKLDLGDGTDGSAISLLVGNNQRLRGTLQKLKPPLAVLDMTAEPQNGEIKVVDVIEYKALFNKRPEPVF